MTSSPRSQPRRRDRRYSREGDIHRWASHQITIRSYASQIHGPASSGPGGQRGAVQLSYTGLDSGEEPLRSLTQVSCDGCPLMRAGGRRACIYDKVRSIAAQ
jgi:hypothetical protein